ncbi:MAG: T9SS type A sorting domain-containing protein [Ignavibacteriae bacterium]|nr:T9SS type A sorting domain-containing protein [Ignavibacteriota bacterium]MCB9214360.1 T9SS type A sorting domain-containing protein [Ignavibacteria bacterium]
MKRFCLALSVLLGVVLGFSKIVAQVQATRTVVGAGAQHTSNSGTYTIVATFGQPIIGTRTIAEKTTYQGFWGPLARSVSEANETFPVAGSANDQLLLRATENPFSTSTELLVYIPQSGEISLRLFDGLGREVRVLLEGEQSVGTYRITLNADALPSGHYMVNLTSGNEHQSLPLLLVQ